MSHGHSHNFNPLEQSVEKKFMDNETLHGLFGAPTMVMSSSHYIILLFEQGIITIVIKFDHQ